MIFNSFSELPKTLQEIIEREIISRIDDFPPKMIETFKNKENLITNYKFDLMRSHFCEEPMRNGDYITKIKAGKDTCYIEIVSSSYDDIVSKVARDIRVEKINKIYEKNN